MNRIIESMIIAVVMIVLAGCTKKDNVKIEETYQSETTVSTTTVSVSGAEDADELHITSEDGKELYMMRIRDEYIELSNDCEEVYCLDPDGYPEMDDGSIVRVVADVDIYNGGEAGYCNNSFIKTVAETEPLDYSEAVLRLNVPGLIGNDFRYGQYLLQYTIDDEHFFAVLCNGDVIVFQDGQMVYEYSFSETEEHMEPLYTYLSTRTYTPPTPDVPQVMPELTEDEILDMDFIHLRGYGDLLAEGLLIDVSTPNRMREEYDLSREDGYIGIGRHAERSAETESDALQTAKDFWVGSTHISYDNIILIGESAEFWLFQADYSMNGEFKAIDTLIVYKKDYYDAENKNAGFELNAENIRHFFAVRYMEPVEESRCIGEFVDERDGIFYYRRYDLQITNDDKDGKNIIEIYETEYSIGEDGQITQIDHFEPVCQVEEN